MVSVAVLGSKGMLGSMVYGYLKKNPSLEVVGFDRDDFDATKDDLDIEFTLSGYDWIVNCIGTIKPRVDEVGVRQTILVNSLFPHKLATLPSKLIHITTDCVFSGVRGDYTESDVHDAPDVYGKSKSLGEPYEGRCYTLRCSIFGPGNRGNLMGWFLSQPFESSVQGYTEHLYNGITTLAFAKICQGIMENGGIMRTQHVIPKDKTTKCDLLEMFAENFRPDIDVLAKDTPPLDMTLSTIYPDDNEYLWLMGGYKEIPTISELVKELADYEKGVK